MWFRETSSEIGALNDVKEVYRLRQYNTEGSVENIQTRKSVAATIFAADTLCVTNMYIKSCMSFVG